MPLRQDSVAKRNKYESDLKTNTVNYFEMHIYIKGESHALSLFLLLAENY